MEYFFTAGFLASVIWLFVIVFFAELASSHWQSRHPVLWRMGFGLILGLMGVLLSMVDFNNPGLKIHYEVYALVGIFFGPLTTAFAMLINTVFFLYTANYPGALAILIAGITGAAWRAARKQSSAHLRWRDLAWLAALTHLLVMAAGYGLSRQAWSTFYTPLNMMYGLIYPITTFVTGTLISRIFRRDQEIKQLQEYAHKLMKSQDIYRILTESMKDVIWTLDTETNRFTYVSPSVEKLRGYTPEEIMAVPVYEALTPAGADEVKTNIARLAEAFRSGAIPAETYFTEDVEQPCKDGSTVWTEAITRFYVNPETNHIEVRGVTRDISTRKKAEQEKEQALQALRESEEGYRLIFEHAADGIFLINKHGQILRANNSACQMLGFTHEEIIQHQFNSLVANPAVTADENGEKITEVQMRSKDGNVIDAEISQQTLPDGQQQIFARNITKRKLAEAESRLAYARLKQLVGEKDQSRLALLSMVEDLKKTEDQIRTLNIMLEQRVAIRTVELEVSNKELEAFAYSVSHDLRAPLRAIDGFSQILEQDFSDKLGDEGKRLLMILRSSAKKMDNLITDILALSRVSRAVLDLAPIDMQSLVKSVYYELASQEIQPKISLEVADLPEVYGDPNLLRQVCVNLISNALKYSAPKPEIKIVIGSVVENEQIVFFIKDNGVGFNPKYKAKLFGVFSRLHKSDQFEGTGVGLAIVQRIINRHGGQVWGDGVLNEGATFYFSLPRQAKAV